jgi:hypothetical protein
MGAVLLGFYPKMGGVLLGFYPKMGAVWKKYEKKAPPWALKTRINPRLLKWLP